MYLDCLKAVSSVGYVSSQVVLGTSTHAHIQRIFFHTFEVFDRQQRSSLPFLGLFVDNRQFALPSAPNLSEFAPISPHIKDIASLHGMWLAIRHGSSAWPFIRGGKSGQVHRSQSPGLCPASRTMHGSQDPKSCELLKGLYIG